MNKLTAALCCLMLAATPVMAQVKSTDKKAVPMTEKELAAKKKAVHEKGGVCASEARRKNLKQGSREFGNFMTQCLKP